jgi:hypothetical protein
MTDVAARFFAEAIIATATDNAHFQRTTHLFGK